jgi:hypothetical protein
MTKMTNRINPIVVVKIVDLDTSHIYNLTIWLEWINVFLVNGPSKSKNMDLSFDWNIKK